MSKKSVNLNFLILVIHQMTPLESQQHESYKLENYFKKHLLRIEQRHLVLLRLKIFVLCINFRTYYVV